MSMVYLLKKRSVELNISVSAETLPLKSINLYACELKMKTESIVCKVIRLGSYLKIRLLKVVM